jgi:hypothetical protein
MRIFKQRQQQQIDRRMALEGVALIRPGVTLEPATGGTVRVSVTRNRGDGFFERMRPPVVKRSYELDEFGSFVIGLVDGHRTVLDVINAFEQRFRMSRREVELAVVAFFKLLMQRDVVAVVVPEPGKPRLAALAFLAFALAGNVCAAPPPAPATTNGTLAELRSLCRDTTSRIPGSPGNLALEKLVEKRFSQSGFKSGELQFKAPAFEPGTLELDCGAGGSFTLDAMHPTLMRPGNFTAGRFDTRLVYFGKGTVEDLDRVKGVALKGALAVLDFDCGDRWMDLLRFDIAGVIFIGQGLTSHGESLAKVYNSEVAVPRFYLDGDAGQRLLGLLKDRQPLAAAAMATPSRWRAQRLRDLWVMIPGADEKSAENVVVITAPLDANSIVPARAPGAQRAVNLHILLKLLDDFKRQKPLYTVLLVAVNAHTLRFEGERQLAWQLLVEGVKVEKLRDELGEEMRLAALQVSEFEKLRLAPVAHTDKADAHIVMELLWQLENEQAEARKEVRTRLLEHYDEAIKSVLAQGRAGGIPETAPVLETDDTLHLENITEAQVRSGLEGARKELISQHDAFLANRGRDAREVEQEKRQDLALLAQLQALPFDALMKRLVRLKDVFEDEKLFERWRGDLDESTGRRVSLKTPLQDAFKSQVNRTMQEVGLLTSGKTKLGGEASAQKQAELQAHVANLRKVLVLFNKIDFGAGRTRTRYRQIAVNDLTRQMLRIEVDRCISLYQQWHNVYRDYLNRDTRCGEIRDVLEGRKVALVLTLDLDGHADQVGLSYHSVAVAPGWFSGFAAICREVAEKTGTRYVDALSGATGLTPAHYFSQPESGIQYFHGAGNTPAFSLKSAYSDPGLVFSPSDTLDQLDPMRLDGLQDWTRRFISGLLAQDKLLDATNLKPVPCKIALWSMLMRTFSLEQFTGKPVPTKPVTNCLAVIYESAVSGGKIAPPALPSIVAGDVVNAYLGISDASASAVFYGLSESRVMAPTVYRMDDQFRTVEYTIDKGRVQVSKQLNSNINKNLRATMPMFECQEFVLKDRRDPTMISDQPIAVNKIWPKIAKGQSDPEKYGVHGAASLSPAKAHLASGPIGVYLYQRRAELEPDALMVITDQKRCLLNATDEEPKGKGFLDQIALGSDPLWNISADMGILNRSRSEDMQGVINQLLDDFQTRGERLHREAEELKAKRDHSGYLRSLYESVGSQVKAYNEIQSMNADMLKAVIVYMALMLPFCFFLQKLIFNFRRMEHELAAFSALFVGMFILFRLIHPAFRMAMSPEAIFIAFVLGAIGVFTTLMLRERFQDEMAILFRGTSGIGEDVGHGTVGTTAMLIGVQNMRRRRVRTALTTATIVLVVFTMLAFTSVSRKASPTLVAKSDAAPYTGLFYHWPVGAPMDEDSARMIRELYADRAEVRLRRLLSREDPWRLELADATGKFLNIRAVSGLPQNDIALRNSLALVEGGMFSAPDAAEILLSVAAADALGLKASDLGRTKVRLLGREWLLKGFYDDQRYRLAVDLNPGLPMVPAKALAAKVRASSSSLDVVVAEGTDALVDTAELALIPEAVAATLGARPSSLSVVFTNAVDEFQMGEEIDRILTVTDAKFFVGSQSAFRLNKEASIPVKAGIYYVGSSYHTAIGGLAKLLIPLLIAGSIILNTMLGTVYERKSEIAVFNAIGLNPTHIFMFFLAEAIVYSFIGAVGGYLIGQLLAIALKAIGLIHDVNINFSSLMVVYAILFTMVLVVVSTLYPGYVATRTAVPSGKRKWSMPPHDGNRMSLVFPFIYQPRLAYGVMYYLQQFFAPLADHSLGDLVAQLEEIKEERDPDGRPILSLRYKVALAPYDLGVTQQVTFTTRYDQVVQSFRLHMDIDRISGRDTNWITTNSPFLERMRKFLIRWRNIDMTRQDWHVDQAVAMFKDGIPPAVEGGKE